MSRILESSKIRVAVVTLLLLAACGLAYTFRTILETGVLFSHFFYIPTILACMWWGRKGFIVTVLLVGILLASQIFFPGHQVQVHELLRGAMLILISLLTVGLSEQLSDTRQELRMSEKKYRKIFETTGTAMIVIEADTTISEVNEEFEKLSGFSAAEIRNNMSWTRFVGPDDKERMLAYHHKRREKPLDVPKKYEFQFANRDGQIRDIMLTIDMIPNSSKSVGAFVDITDLKRSIMKQKELQEKLTEALARALNGFIPICSNCKKIRDEEEHWVEVEAYISRKTSADFSHGICPECAKMLYGHIMGKGLSDHGRAGSGHSV
jgi:PAS domain S-box-containing protein